MGELITHEPVLVEVEGLKRDDDTNPRLGDVDLWVCRADARNVEVENEHLGEFEEPVARVSRGTTWPIGDLRKHLPFTLNE